MLRWMGSQKSPTEPEVYSSVVTGLQKLYRKNLLSLEKDYKFANFYSPLLTDGDFAAKPMVLLIGQYSTGKTTFIQHLLERDYPGQRIGPEPTTDQFVAVMHGQDEQVVPGNAAVVDRTSPWSQLQEFGNAFLTRFHCAVVNSPVLKGLTLIDTPGVLSGNKQSERGYNFEGVIKWFAERVDLILLMFDAHKLDISDEFRRCINSLKGNDQKIRILLNKADLVSPQQLMRVYGALMWSLGKVVKTPEVTRVFIGSFWDAPLNFAEYRKLFEAEASDLYSDIASLPKYAAVRKLNDFIKRCRLAKVHALILNHIKKQMPLFGKTAKQRELTRNLEQVYQAVSREHNLALGDFPSIELLQEKLPDLEVSKLPKLDLKRLAAIDDVLSRSIPTVMKLLPFESHKAIAESEPADGMMVAAQPSPFLALGSEAPGKSMPLWAAKKYLSDPPNLDLYRKDFEALGPDSHGLITGTQAKPDLVRVSGMPSSVLHRIWNISDITHDGCLDLFEYSLARQFIDMKTQGFELPHKTPDAFMAGVRSGGSGSNILAGGRRSSDDSGRQSQRGSGRWGGASGRMSGGSFRSDPTGDLGAHSTDKATHSTAESNYGNTTINTNNNIHGNDGGGGGNSRRHRQVSREDSFTSSSMPGGGGYRAVTGVRNLSTADNAQAVGYVSSTPNAVVCSPSSLSSSLGAGGTERSFLGQHERATTAASGSSPNQNVSEDLMSTDGGRQHLLLGRGGRGLSFQKAELSGQEIPGSPFLVKTPPTSKSATSSSSPSSVASSAASEQPASVPSEADTSPPNVTSVTEDVVNAETGPDQISSTQSEGSAPAARDLIYTPLASTPAVESYDCSIQSQSPSQTSPNSVTAVLDEAVSTPVEMDSIANRTGGSGAGEKTISLQNLGTDSDCLSADSPTAIRDPADWSK